MLPETDATAIHKIFEELGPTARLCIEYASDPEQLRDYEGELDDEISNIMTGKLEELIKESTRLTMDAVSHKICLISCRDPKNMRSTPLVSPITDSIKSRLSNQLRNLQQAEWIRLFKQLERVPGARATAGIVYEAQAQYLLQQGRCLEISRLQALSQRVSVDIQLSETLEYMDDELESLESNVFYVPEKTNKSALDSFILLGDILYIFQMTIKPIHDINRGLIDSADRHNFPLRAKWRFVFIIPPNLVLKVPKPWKLELRSLSLYSAVAPVEMAQSR